MNKEEAYRNLVDAQSNVLDVLRSQSELHGMRLNNLTDAVDAIGRMAEAHSELIVALQETYDAKIAAIVTRLDAL
jgi:hypothetical protein